MQGNNFNEIDIALSAFSDKVAEKINAIAKDEAEKGAKELQSTSPKKTGKYRKGWSVKSIKDNVIIYNKKRGGLTHLLENDRRIVGKNKKYYGTKKGTPHIKPVRDKLDVDIVNRVKQELG